MEKGVIRDDMKKLVLKNAQMYLKGESGAAMNLVNITKGKFPVTVGAEGKVAALLGYSGNVRGGLTTIGMQATAYAAPVISILEGQVVFDMSSAMDARLSCYFEVRGEKDYTIAARVKVDLGPDYIINTVLPALPDEVNNGLSLLMGSLKTTNIDFYMRGGDPLWYLSVTLTNLPLFKVLFGEFKHPYNTHLFNRQSL